ncbi:hypothetical protein D3C83_260890 [compost metagenome]
MLVLEGHEDHALGRAGALAHQDDAADRHAPVVGDAAERVVRRDTALAEGGAQQLEGMRLQ